MSFLSVVEADLKDVEGWIGTVEKELVTMIEAIISAEYQTIVTQIIPLLKTAAVTLQNEAPGLNAQTFIPALVSAVVPVLPVALKDLQVTAISAFASVVAGQLNVPNTTGNQGVVTGTPPVSAPPATGSTT